MAMNKYMHPRNIFRTPPDFKQLYDIYPEFAKVAKLTINNKVCVDFKDPQTLRVLTKCLLKSHFNLNVDIPDDRLVPTLPLRLNYILWLEDLMSAINVDDAKGIDIGTGPCAIYPLLGAVKNKWNMIGTDSDEYSVEMAKNNVSNNKLDDLIQIVQTSSSSTLLEHLFANEDNNKQYDFCMCNPPFYSSIEELYESRSPARPPPKNAFTGSPQELICKGGELEFVRQLISESKKLKENVQIYTSMIGHKYNMRVLSEELTSEDIKHTSTEFCQGRVTRWGLAWTFKDYNLELLVPPNKSEKKESPPMVYCLPKTNETDYNLQSTHKKLTQLFTDLQINIKEIFKGDSCIILDIVANTNTWSNQRKRRRLLKRLEEESKKIKLDCEIPTVCDEEKTNIECKANEVDNNASEPVINAICKINSKGKDLLLEFSFTKGTGGKEGVHQIIQYIKNNWK